MAKRQLRYPVYFPLKIEEGLVERPFRPDYTDAVDEEALADTLKEINDERFDGRLRAGIEVERRKKFWVGKTKYAGFAQFNPETGNIEVAPYTALLAFPESVRKAAIYLAALHAYAFEANDGKVWPLNRGDDGALFVEWANREMSKFPGHRAYIQMKKVFYRWACENLKPRG